MVFLRSIDYNLLISNSTDTSNKLHASRQYRIKYYKSPLDSDLVTSFNDKDSQKTTKEYEFLLNEKQSTLDNYQVTRHCL